MKIERKKIEGYAYGAIQPSVTLRFSDVPSVSNILTTEFARVRESLPSFDDANRFSADGSVVDLNTAPALYVTIVDMLNYHCGDQRFTAIKVFEEGGALCFAVPTLSPEMVFFNSNAIQPFMSKLGRGMSHEDVVEFVEKQRQQARRFLPSGTNAGSFIAAAVERKIPFKIFNRRYIIFGYGSGSSIFNSSITDKDSSIGVSIAKSKVDTNRLLKMSGFPVAEQARVHTLEDAVRFAKKVGYPVVLKPENEEQGRGVCPFLQTEDELVQTYKILEKRYNNIIAERHYVGDGYRVFVLKNDVVRARKHEAAHVIGDGASTIRQLIEKENHSRHRSLVTGALKMLVVDEEVVKMLAKQQCKLSDLPPAGKKITLSPTSNVSRGGTSTDFFLDLHPENKLLCEQVTKTIGLHCSGVDLISADASVPWYLNGAIVCEVNSQPQIGLVGKVLMHHQMIVDAKIARLPISLKVVRRTTDVSVNLFNKCDEQLTIVLSFEEILRSGSPVQYFDTLEISEDIPRDIRRKLEHILLSVEPEPSAALDQNTTSLTCPPRVPHS